jgi:hypothetical protein
MQGNFIQQILLIPFFKEKDLADKLTHPENREKVINFMKGKCVRTLYPNRAGETKVFTFGGITHKPARIEKAYEGFLNVTVQQHMYARKHKHVPTNQSTSI